MTACKATWPAVESTDSIAIERGCFHGGAFFDAIGPRFDRLHRRQAVVNADVLDAWFDPSPRVLRALHDHLPWLIKTSPPTQAAGLVETIAEQRGVEPACVLPGAGSSDLIYLGMRHWLKPDSRVLLLDPTYGEYTHVLDHVIGCQVDRLELRSEDNFDLDPDLLRQSMKRAYDLIVLVNPNSPTGRHVSGAAMERLLGDIPLSTRVWVDETYVDYLGPGHSLEAFAARSRGVVVCKSMSKVYALSGVRAAYLCGPRELIAALRPLNPPWAVSLPAQVAAVAALHDPAYYEGRYKRTAELRDRFAERLREIGVGVFPGEANFLLCRLPGHTPTPHTVIRSCAERLVYLRDPSTMGGGLNQRMLRIAIKGLDDQDRILDALRRAIAPPRFTSPSSVAR